ncbi:TetR/AcrR family transcriptional regulator [Jatrophihabitans sp. DSM 45814]
MLDVKYSVKEQLVSAAERLFAQHGVQGVSLRQIGAAAGNANNSAVQYHFGTKQQLVQAIYEYRLTGLCTRREELIAQRRPDDLRSWVECQLFSVIEQADQPGSHYMGFISAASTDGWSEVFVLPPSLRARVAAFHDRLSSLLPELDEPVRSRRIQQAQSFIVLAAAQRERARDAGRPLLPTAIAVTELIDGMVGFLQAPTSIDTRLELDWAGEAHPNVPLLF